MFNNRTQHSIPPYHATRSETNSFVRECTGLINELRMRTGSRSNLVKLLFMKVLKFYLQTFQPKAGLPRGGGVRKHFIFEQTGAWDFWSTVVDTASLQLKCCYQSARNLKNSTLFVLNSSSHIPRPSLFVYLFRYQLHNRFGFKFL